MAGSVLSYRVYRLRRLIAVCLGLLPVGIGVGIWLVPGAADSVLVVFGVGVFSILAIAHLAMIVIWPTDPGGPLTYAIGTLILLAIAMPAGAYQVSTGTEAATLLVIGVMLGPLIWFVGAPWIGGWVCRGAGLVSPQKVQQARAFDLPVDMARAITLFAMDPDKKRVLSVHGPVGWDGCFEETATRLVADFQTGELAAQKTVSRFLPLASDATTRSVLVTTAIASDVTISIVIHQHFEATPNGTRLIERLDIEGAPGLALFLGWLSDSAGDYVTAELDADTGRPPRAMAHMPLDSMGLALTRFLKWGDPPMG